MPDESTTYKVSSHHRCFGCFRPKNYCFCSAIPHIQNATRVLILQHRRERMHAFNTARIVQRALSQCDVSVGYPQDFSKQDKGQLDGAVLLFPGPDSVLLSDLSLEHRPSQLVIVDGTWHQARTIVRDVPWLKKLPQVRLAPDRPGRYRIRREPDKHSLSSLEATAAALAVLEPHTVGLDQLELAFDTLIQDQLAHPNMKRHWRRNSRRGAINLGIPRAIAANLDDIVVAYGESTPGNSDTHDGPRLPLYWVAERLGTAEKFACRIRPPAPLSKVFLGHLRLSQTDFVDAVSLPEFCESWSDFLRPKDTMVVYHEGSANLLRSAGATLPRYVVLKSIWRNFRRDSERMREIYRASPGCAPSSSQPGRAGRRLSDAIALTLYFHAQSQE